MTTRLTNELDKDLIMLMSDFGKKMKSTLTIVSGDTIFGLNGEIMDEGLIDIGVVKMIDNHDETIDMGPLHRYSNENHIEDLAIMTKDFNTIQKELEEHPEEKILLSGDYSNGRLVRSVLDLSVGDISIPVFSNRMYWNSYHAVMEMMFRSNPTFKDMDITDNIQFQEMIGKKASYGGMFVHINDYREYMNGSIVNMNKGDTVLCTMYDFGNTSLFDVITVKKKKKCNVHSISFMLNMR